MKDFYNESKLIGMLLTVEATLNSMRELMQRYDLFEEDATIVACLETSVALTATAHKKMSWFLEHAND